MVRWKPPGLILGFQLSSLLRLGLGCGSFPGGSSGKESTCQYRRHNRLRLDPRVRKIPWRRAWQPIPVLSPGESNGPRSMAGYSPWGCKESDRTEAT